MQTLWANFARNPVDVSSVISVAASRGFYGWESDGVLKWNWASLDTELQVRNDQQESVSVILEFTLVAGDSRMVSISTDAGAKLASVVIDPTHPATFKLPVDLGAGITTINLHSALQHCTNLIPASLHFNSVDLDCDCQTLNSRPRYIRHSIYLGRVEGTDYLNQHNPAHGPHAGESSQILCGLGPYTVEI